MDIVLAFPVALLVFWSGWSVLKENLPWLVDEMAIAPEAIHAIATRVPGVTNCHEIASRGLLGRQVFIEMHLVINATDGETAHQITEEVEDRLEERYGPARVIIHVEPPAYKSTQIATSLQNQSSRNTPAGLTRLPTSTCGNQTMQFEQGNFPNQPGLSVTE